MNNRLLKMMLLSILVSGAMVLRNTHLIAAPEWSESPLLPSGMRTGLLDLVPGFQGVSATGVHYSINDWGYRDDPVDPTQQQVIFLGDSTTFGLNLSHEDTYAEVWERIAGKNLQALNTAAPGHGTSTEYRELQTLLNRGVQPVGVVVGYYATHPTDGLWDNTTWDYSAGYLQQIHALAIEKGFSMAIVYLPSRAASLLKPSKAQQTVRHFAQQETIPFIDGWTLYRQYMEVNHLTSADTLFSVPGHPSSIASQLLGEALAKVMP
jgi:hypothetical protein